MDEWHAPYEVATEADAARTIGPFPARAVGTVAMLVLLPLASYVLSGFWLHLPWRLLPAIIGLLVAIRWARPHRGRRFSEALPRLLRHWSLPRRLEASLLEQTHIRIASTEDSTITTDDPAAPVRAVVRIDSPVNLRLLADEDLGAYIRRFAVFLSGLRFPVHLVVRSTPVDLPAFKVGGPQASALDVFLHDQARNLNLLERQWYVGVSAPTATVLTERVKATVEGIKRAGLRSHRVDGKLRDELNQCWGTVVSSGLGPRVLTRHTEYAEVDGTLVRGLLLKQLPRSVDPNWLASLLDSDVACDLSVWVEPLEQAQEISGLDYRISEWTASQDITYARSGVRNPDLDIRLADAIRMRLALARRQLRRFEVTLLFVVRARTREELDRTEAQVRDLLREQIGGNPVLACDFEHDLAARQVVPLGAVDIRHPVKVETPALARTYVWSSSTLAMPGGVPWGIASNRPVLLDPFAFPNPHMFCAATSGAGKGYSVKVLLYRWYWMDPDVSFLIIDQDERSEYSGLAEAVGGRVYRVTDADEPAGKYHGWSVNGEWQVPRVQRMRVYNLSGLDPALRPLAIRRLIEHVERTSLGNARRGKKWVIVIDELWTLLDPRAPSHAGETVERLWRKGRHGRIMGIGISQRPSDALGTERGQVLLDISAINWLLWCKPTEMARTAASMGLSPGERSFLEEAETGSGILTVPGRRLAMHIEASTAEDEMACT